MSGAKFSRGRPIKLEGTEKQLIRRKHRRRQREIQKQMHQLEKLCAPFGSPAQFEGILKSVSSTRPGKTLLPEVASNSRTTEALSGLLESRSTMKQGLVRELTQRGAAPSDLARSLKVRVNSIKKYSSSNNAAARDSQTKLAKKTREDARRQKIFPGEMDAITKHAQDHMYVKSGAATDVWLLTYSLKNLYVSYRRDFIEIMENMIEKGKLYSDTSKISSHVYLNNCRLIREGITDIEPWKEHITSIKLFLGKRRAANLSTKACTNLIVNDGGKMEVVEVKPPEHQDHKELVDYASMPTELDAKLERSRKANDQLRPRGYKTWKAIITSNEDFRWRSVRTPYSCDICKGAYGVERRWSIASEEYLGVDPKSPEKLVALNKVWDAYKDMAKLEQHQLQLKNQRFYIQALERDLPPKSVDVFKVIVYLDFVAQYNYAKKKVANLVFTIKWKDEGGNLQYKYVDNFCSDKTQKADAMFVKAAWEFHLRAVFLRKQLATFGVLLDTTRAAYQVELDAIKKTGKRDEFEGVTHIVRTGDNGGHLLNRILMNVESNVMRDYGIHYETHTLPKRHGYNLCDAHGGAVKRTINQFGVSNYDPANAHDFANIVNGWVTGLTADCIRHASCTAYSFVNIQRGDKEELAAAKRDCTGMQLGCSFVYTCKNHQGEVVHEPGIMQVKEVSGCKEEEPLILDIQKRDKTMYGKICNGCTRIKEYPVYHKKDIFTDQQTKCGFNAAKGKLLSFKRPGMYPHATRGKFLKVPVVQQLMSGKSVPKQTLTKTSSANITSQTPSSVMGTAASDSPLSSSSRNQSRCTDGRFDKKTDKEAPLRKKKPCVSTTTLTTTSSTITLQTSSVPASSTAATAPSDTLSSVSGSGLPVSTSSLSSSSVLESEVDSDNPDLHWLIRIKSNTYEYEDGKLVPIYECKWHKEKETTWQHENSLPTDMLVAFKKDKKRFRSEKSFRKLMEAKTNTSKETMKSTVDQGQYMKKRQENIHENNQKMISLGLQPVASSSSNEPKKRKPEQDLEPLPSRQQPSRGCKKVRVSATGSSASGSSSTSSESAASESSSSSSSSGSESDSS